MVALVATLTNPCGKKMERAKVKRIAVSTAAIASMLLGATAISAQDERIGQMVDEVGKTSKIAQASQQRIDAVADQTDKLFDQYKSTLKVIAGLEAYNANQRRVIEGQEREIATLQRAITQVDVIKRQVTPLMEDMIADLETFVSQDMPFLREDRMKRIEDLKSYMVDPNIADPERFRLVLDAYKTEADFGSGYAAFPGDLDDGRSVNFVRIGRVGLYYQTKDGNESGVWNGSGWDVLPADYNKAVRDLSRMAERMIPVDVLTLPIVAPE